MLLTSVALMVVLEEDLEDHVEASVVASALWFDSVSIMR